MFFLFFFSLYNESEKSLIESEKTNFFLFFFLF